MKQDTGLQIAHAFLLFRRCFSGNDLLGRRAEQLVELVKAGVHVTSLFPRFIGLDQQSLALSDGIARGSERSVQC
jgi:hypothetical protein